jgi:hypothetical protein
VCKLDQCTSRFFSSAESRSMRRGGAEGHRGASLLAAADSNGTMHVCT